MGFADLVLANSVESARKRIDSLISIVNSWMRNHGLELATQKTEMEVLARQRWFETPFCVSTNGVNITAKRVTRYLGFELDDKLTFRDNLRKTTEKAGKPVSSLTKLMLNTVGPRYAKRRVLLSVVHSILLYGDEIWANKMRIKTFRSKLASVQRRAALRVTCAYKTVSEAAILVLAKPRQ